jgi:hypothetical protein
MPALIIPKPFRKILVVSLIYNKMDKLSQIEEMIPQYDFTIFNGGLLYPVDDNIQQRIDKMNQITSTSKSVYLAGRLDYMQANSSPELNKWIHGCYNVAIADFTSRTVIVVDGGIPPNVTRQDLSNNIEVSFISQIDNKPWHLNYNGGLGYVISNNPLTVTTPQYYKYSMQMGNQYTPESLVYAQEVDEVGLKKLFPI